MCLRILCTGENNAWLQSAPTAPSAFRKLHIHSTGAAILLDIGGKNKATLWLQKHVPASIDAKTERGIYSPDRSLH